MKLLFSESAVDDLTRLREFIAQHNPKAAQRVAQRLRGTIQRLVPDLPGEIRELIFGKYVVRYEVRMNSIYILRIWRGKEDR